MSAFDIELSSPLGPEFTGGLGGPGQGGHTGNDWFIRFGMDLAAPGGAEVRASFDGHVTVFHPHDPAADSGKVFGAQIFMRDPSDRMGAFYTHMTDVPAEVQTGATLSRGDLIGRVFEFGGIPGHVHMAVTEILGGPENGTRVGVDLYDLFLSMGDNQQRAMVTFFQEEGRPPELSGGAPQPTAFDLSSLRGIQQGLTALGFDPGDDDGIDGPLTQGAVRAFQAANGLEETGVCEGETLTALADALTANGFTVVGV